MIFEGFWNYIDSMSEKKRLWLFKFPQGPIILIIGINLYPIIFNEVLASSNKYLAYAVTGFFLFGIIVTAMSILGDFIKRLKDAKRGREE